MPLLMLKDLPRYECLLECSERFPALNPGSTEVFLHLLHTVDQLFSMKEAFLNRNGLSNGRFTVLLLLTTSEPDPKFGVGALTPAELADRGGVTRATMTGLIDTLEKTEMVTRVPDPDDRRMMRVVLTKKAQRFVNKILPPYFSLVAKVMNPLPEKEQNEMKRLLAKVRDGVASATAVSAEVA